MKLLALASKLTPGASNLSAKSSIFLLIGNWHLIWYVSNIKIFDVRQSSVKAYWTYSIDCESVRPDPRAKSYDCSKIEGTYMGYFLKKQTMLGMFLIEIRKRESHREKHCKAAPIADSNRNIKQDGSSYATNKKQQ